MQSLNPASDQSSRFHTIQHVLDKLCKENQFTAVVLVGEEGLSLASGSCPEDLEEAATRQDPDVIAAVIAHMWSATRMARRQLHLPVVDEITMMVRGGLRLVARTLDVGDEVLILTILMPYWMSYHKATAEALESIRRSWGM